MSIEEIKARKIQVLSSNSCGKIYISLVSK